MKPYMPICHAVSDKRVGLDRGHEAPARSDSPRIGAIVKY